MWNFVNKYCLFSAHSYHAEIDVKNVLSTVTNWFELGEQLDIAYDDLEAIEVDYAHHGTKRQRSKMVHTWLQREPAASWSKLCAALENMGEKSAAEGIKAKHCTDMH